MPTSVHHTLHHGVVAAGILAFLVIVLRVRASIELSGTRIHLDISMARLAAKVKDLTATSVV